MKKCTVIAIVFVLVVSCVSVAFAAENDKISCSDDQSGVLYSEAEMILLSEMDGQQLERKGFTQSEIRDIKKIDYRELILQRAALPYETLRGYGYSDEQIRILKDYKGEEWC